MEVLHCNCRTYSRVHLITFKVGPLHGHTLVPSILLFLVAPAGGFFWNLPEFGRRIRFDVRHNCETCPLEANFQSMESQKSYSERDPESTVFGWWLGRKIFLGEELLHNKRCVARCVIAMQKPLSLPLVAPLPPNCSAQPLHADMTSNTLSRRYELMAH
jgi:hypothetical protein